MAIDFGRSAQDYSTHRAEFPESLYEWVFAWKIGLTGQKIVDFGTGTGAMARGFARRGCQVIGLDVSENMLQEARRLAARENLQIEFRLASAEQSGLPDGSADVVTAGQCWHWFDGPAAAQEARRLLMQNGKVLIAHFDWIPLMGNIVAETEALILNHNPEWKMGGGSGIYPRWFRHLAEAGFRKLKSFSYDLDVPYTHEGWRGRIRASAGVGAKLSPAGVAEFDATLARLLAEKFPQEVLEVPHRIFALLGRRGS